GYQFQPLENVGVGEKLPANHVLNPINLRRLPHGIATLSEPGLQDAPPDAPGAALGAAPTPPPRPGPRTARRGSPPVRTRARQRPRPALPPPLPRRPEPPPAGSRAWRGRGRRAVPRRRDGALGGGSPVHPQAASAYPAPFAGAGIAIAFCRAA